LGETHPRVAIRLYNLATALAAAGWNAEAIVRYRAALAIDQKNLGPSHPDLSPVLKELAMSLEREGNYSDAEATLRRALAIDERFEGFIADETAITWARLAGLFHASDRAGDAEEAAIRALAIVRILDPGRRSHPFIQRVSANVRSILHAFGRTNDEIAGQADALAARLREEQPLRAGGARSRG
jgi:serine/threonine-protein kinase